jgi:MFS family permease
MSELALPWFVLATTHSPARMGIVLAVQLLGMAVVGIPGGAIATRLGARRTLVVCDLARAPLVAAVPTLHALCLLRFPLLIALVFATGAFLAPYFASQRTILPELLGEDERVMAEAASLLQSANRMTILLGPPLAGVLIAAFGASTVLVVDAATYLVSAFVVTVLVPRPAAGVGAEALDAGGVFAGLVFLWRDRLLRAWTVAFASFELAWQALFALVPIVAFERYHDARVGGWLFAAFGGGALVGTVAASRLVRRVDPLLLVSIGKIPQALVFWWLAFPVGAVGLGVVLAISGALNGVIFAPATAIQTARTPAALRTKAGTASVTLMLLAGAAGFALAGPLVQSIGTKPVLVGVAFLQTLGGLLLTPVGLRAYAAGRTRAAPAGRRT